mmetsp:Transcript_31059/g.51740  ORF Transcript_31059/g.51740 Transcript_31059/m.51740 type:complete len:90 (+) Transcript_31059:337-606(+)
MIDATSDRTPHFHLWAKPHPERHEEHRRPSAASTGSLEQLPEPAVPTFRLRFHRESSKGVTPPREVHQPHHHHHHELKEPAMPNFHTWF